jgi:hypothetical protein
MDWQSIEQIVWLTWTPCNYGGQRPWFICPNEVNGHRCKRRVAVLYLASRYFLCRHCCQLAYQSQNETEWERARRKEEKILEKLRGTRESTELLLSKPKGMHQKTFNRLTDQADEAGYRSAMLFYDRMTRLGILSRDPMIDLIRQALNRFGKE